ncbi:two-component sensor histidine kinase [Actinorhabdospora filicis]|uniref:histidine kinase n=1 Tax=Actinorhabdospora filicis TaxID=1785913 RepID=A0A9W6SJ19_9ACTN|nr:HAMP domain-containing sensor histidine kinase [Actinorhabdospora filicis]GLZ75566.1 two-component sensor histidine kinase [Actinorhabdospora filicis]
MTLSIRARVAVTAALAAAIAAVLALLAAYIVTSHELTAEVDLSLVRAAKNVQRQVRAGTWVHAGECLWLSSPGCVQFVTADGTVTPEPDGTQPPVDPRVRDVASGARGPFFADDEVGGYPVRSYVEWIEGDTAVQISVRADSVDRGLTRVGAALAVTGLAAVVLAAALGWLVARTSLRPVTGLSRAAQDIAASRDTRRRVTVTGRDEVARLAASINTMLDALDGAVDAQRQLVADASHELRTPLTSLRAGVDLLARGLPPERAEKVLAGLRAQGVELTGLVNDLIELARGDEPGRHTEEVRLDALVRHCVESARRNWPGVEFTTDLAPTVLDGSPDRLARAVGNLLDNAAKFSGGAVSGGAASGGTVAVSLRDGVVRVADDGPGIAAADLPHVFDRFYRADASRALPGSGLGLAIVRQVAEAHGGTATARSAPGKGTVMELALPGAEPA